MMQADPSVVRDMLRHCMVARIATLSRAGRPSVTPLYFVVLDDHIWLGTVDWTLAARNVRSDQRASILFAVEQEPASHHVLRITGHARVRTDPQAQRAYRLRVACKYVFTPGAIRNVLTHLWLLPLRRAYHAQAAQQGQPCVIEVSPEQVELLNDEMFS
ncbi:MAG TPA: pyridoxamine 5'-phosphate oxidase family protein [Ktedonobacteraceae bacterium]|nr:pyridoxamine 5'-phosphate oxidase family protein [Ktedonobacteraceae bacterium]